ncbi:MAG: TIGR01906 family membrane protein [Anaerolineae bacterium]|jgi:integral membrane protein (TIGR01906 family)|nr:TIGR01906 family membrane protein [Anaerolineae bacterium]
MRYVLRLLIVIAAPIVLTLVVVRGLTSPWFATVEYARPNFPADPFGFSRGERLRLAQATIRYLNLLGRPSILEDLRLSDGQTAYNERELGHMEDVKAVFDGLTALAAAALVVAVSAGYALARRVDRCAPWSALVQGGALTLAILAGLALWMVVGFDRFFTALHGIFFESGTWVFSYSDTLIRLFPLEFWEDAGMLVAGGVSGLALLAVAAGVVLGRRCTGQR